MYGKCIVADYNSVHKDKCSKEFLKFKDCYLVSTSHIVVLGVSDLVLALLTASQERISATRLTRLRAHTGDEAVIILLLV